MRKAPKSYQAKLFGIQDNEKYPSTIKDIVVQDDESKKSLELKAGMRIQYTDLSGKTRAEKIVENKSNTIIVENVLKHKTRIHINQVRGYWEAEKKASAENMIRIQKAI